MKIELDITIRLAPEQIEAIKKAISAVGAVKLDSILKSANTQEDEEEGEDDEV